MATTYEYEVVLVQVHINSKGVQQSLEIQNMKKDYVFSYFLSLDPGA